MAGEMYVKCQAGWLSLFPEERVDFPPPVGDLHELEHVSDVLERSEMEEGRRPPEGGDARTSGTKDHELPF